MDFQTIKRLNTGSMFLHYQSFSTFPTVPNVVICQERVVLIMAGQEFRHH